MIAAGTTPIGFYANQVLMWTLAFGYNDIQKRLIRDTLASSLRFHRFGHHIRDDKERIENKRVGHTCHLKEQKRKKSHYSPSPSVALDIHVTPHGRC
jgi:hypothetical protein